MVGDAPHKVAFTSYCEPAFMVYKIKVYAFLSLQEENPVHPCFPSHTLAVLPFNIYPSLQVYMATVRITGVLVSGSYVTLP